MITGRSYWMNVLSCSLAGIASLVLAGCSVEARKIRHQERADRYFAAGEYEKAKIEYLNVLRLSFRDPKAIHQLGLAWLEEGEPLRAYPYLLQTRNDAPDDLDSRARFAATLATLGELAAARKEARAVLEQMPGNEEALLVLSDTAYSQEEIQETEKQFLKTPEQADCVYHLAWATLANRMGDISYAKSELEEAIKTDPHSARAHLMAAVFYSSQRDIAKADCEFQTAVELSSHRPETALKYAQFLRDSGKTESASTLLTKIIKQAPDYQPARCLLAEIAFDLGKSDQALTLLENVLDIDYANIDAVVLQSRIFLARGDTKKALECVQRLDLAYPDTPVIKYELARVYLQNNDPSQA